MLNQYIHDRAQFILIIFLQGLAFCWLWLIRCIGHNSGFCNNATPAYGLKVVWVFWRSVICWNYFISLNKVNNRRTLCAYCIFHCRIKRIRFSLAGNFLVFSFFSLVRSYYCESRKSLVDIFPREARYCYRRYHSQVCR